MGDEQIIGTCAGPYMGLNKRRQICGGPVALGNIGHDMLPINTRCLWCGAVARGRFGNYVEMIPPSTQSQE